MNLACGPGRWLLLAALALPAAAQPDGTPQGGVDPRREGVALGR